MGLEYLILELIEKSGLWDAGPEDIEIAREYLKEGEYGLAWDQLVSQIYEYQIDIDQDYYDLVEEITQKMRIGEKEYGFLRGLIKIAAP